MLDKINDIKSTTSLKIGFRKDHQCLLYQIMKNNYKN